MPVLFWGEFYLPLRKDFASFWTLTDLKSFPKLCEVLLDWGNFRLSLYILLKQVMTVVRAFQQRKCI